MKIITCFFIIIIFVCLRKKSNSNFIDYDSSNVLKGLMAIMVIIHHFGCKGIDCNPNWFFWSIMFFGFVAVGIFFFLSGYGLMNSLKKKGTCYSKEILLKKIPKLYFIYIFINLIFFTVYLILGKISFNTTSVLSIFGICRFYNKYHINEFDWFIINIIAFYILFAVIALIVNKLKHKDIWLVIFMCIILTILFYIIKVFNVDYIIGLRAFFCFPLGMIFSVFYKQINKIFSNNIVWLISLMVLISLLVILIIKPTKNVENTSPFIFCLLIGITSLKLTFKSKYISFIGKASLEIYLIQALFFTCFSFMVDQKYNPILFIIIILVLTVSVGLLINKIITLVSQYISNKIHHVK